MTFEEFVDQTLPADTSAWQRALVARWAAGERLIVSASVPRRIRIPEEALRLYAELTGTRVAVATPTGTRYYGPLRSG